MFIALTGTIGSGKTTVAEYLITQGFLFASGSELIATEVTRRNLPVTREYMRAIANELRSRDGNAIIDATIVQVASGPNAAIGFLRTKNEIKRLREKVPHAFLLAIDAPVEIRYDRITKRGETKDMLNFEDFILSENLEATSDDPDTQNTAYCLKQADAIVMNDGSLDDLYQKVRARHREVFAKFFPDETERYRQLLEA
ncbi:dephospho-CoA kinase [Candidatus Kaiserbacteria bacterium]|nr:dephospho-CoA kinase [Candidatus Kaiserbacteria bacterium]